MRKTTPTCPYCGGETEDDHYKERYWFYCRNCAATSPVGEGRTEARNKALHRASPWHSVKDGLPDIGTMCVLQGSVEGGKYTGYILAHMGITGFEAFGLRDIEATHWMELPEAPEEVIGV